VDSIDDVAALREYAKRFKTESVQKAAAHKELQTKMTLFVGKYQKIDAQLKQKTERVKELEAKMNQSIMAQSQSQVAMQNAAAFEQKAEELDRHVQRLQRELNEASHALKVRTSQYENINAKLNEMAAVQQLNNSSDEIRKLKETNRRLKMEADDLRSRLQRAEKINSSSAQSHHHVVSSSDDEAGYHHLNSSFNSIKSEDGIDSAGAKTALDEDDDLLAMLDDALPAAPVASSIPPTSSFKEPEPEKKKMRAKKAAAPKAKATSSKKSATTASATPAPIALQPCTHDAEIQSLKDENGALKTEVVYLNERIQALQADLSVAQQESRSSHDQLVSLRQRLADMLGIPFVAPAAPTPSAAPLQVASVPAPSVRPSPTVPAPTAHTRPNTAPPVQMFGIPDDDEADQMTVDVPAAPTPVPVAQTRPTTVQSSSSTTSVSSVSSAGTVKSSAAASAVSSTIVSRPAVPEAETEAKKTKKRAAPSDTPPAAEARPAKKAKLSEASPAAAPPKATAALPRLPNKPLVVTEPKGNPVSDQSKLRSEIEAAIRTFPSALLSLAPSELFLALFKPENTTKCFTDKVLHHIIALLRQELSSDALIEALFGAVSRQEKDTSMETICEMDLDQGRFVEQRIAAALDSITGAAAPHFLDSFADALLSVPRTTAFYVIAWYVFSTHFFLSFLSPLVRTVAFSSRLPSGLTSFRRHKRWLLIYFLKLVVFHHA
jgi:hypothetical protein